MSAVAISTLLNMTVLAGAMDYAEAREQMLESGRPLVVLVGADWCPACRQMKSSVMPEVARRGGLEEVSFSMVNTDRRSGLARKLMSGGSIPQLVMYRRTDEGWRRTQLTGAQSPQQVERFIERGLADALVEETKPDAGTTASASDEGDAGQMN